MAAADIQRDGNVSTPIRMIVVLLAGVLIGGAAVWALSNTAFPDGTSPADFYVLKGKTTNVSYDATQFGFVQEPLEHPQIGLDGFQGFVSADVQWRREGETTWHSGTPDCLQPGAEGHPVTLGVFHGYDTQVTDQGYSELAWIIC